MDCYKIEWKGFFSLDDAPNRPETKEDGVYAYYKASTKKTNELWYIGKTKDFGRRLNEHKRGASHFQGEKDLGKLSICFGTIYFMQGSKTSTDISPKQLGDIESFFINFANPAPKGNSEATKKGYKGESILVVNTGTIGSFDKIMCRNPELLKLIKGVYEPKKKVVKKSSSLLSGLNF
jgi:hypothetical protein